MFAARIAGPRTSRRARVRFTRVRSAQRSPASRPCGRTSTLFFAGIEREPAMLARMVKARACKLVSVRVTAAVRYVRCSA